MINLDKLVEVGFSVSTATDLSAFFRNVGYLANGSTAVKSGVVIPQNYIFFIDSIDTLNSTLKSDSQEYADIKVILEQKGNMNPNRGRVNNVILYVQEKGVDVTWEDFVNEFISVNANWSQLIINSTVDSDIQSAAAAALSNNRLFLANVKSDDIANALSGNIAIQLNALNNANTMLCYHKTAGENLAAGLAGIMANPNLGATGALYSTVTDVTPENYLATTNNYLEQQCVTFYSTVNAINGGGVTQYATPIVIGGKKTGSSVISGVGMINGEDAKRRYIRFYLDIMMKARCIDFLKKKLNYEDVSADILLSMLKAILKAGQTNGLIKQDSIVKSGDETIETLGYEVKTVYPSELREVDEALYNAQTYKVVGYYRDALTGRKVEIDLFIDPTEAEKSTLGF